MKDYVSPRYDTDVIALCQIDKHITAVGWEHSSGAIFWYLDLDDKYRMSSTGVGRNLKVWEPDGPIGWRHRMEEELSPKQYIAYVKLIAVAAKLQTWLIEWERL